MKSTGIVREVDNFGRISIPFRLRKRMKINDNQPIEIFFDDDKLILMKKDERCIFCDETDNLVKYKYRLLCESCLENILD